MSRHFLLTLALVLDSFIGLKSQSFEFKYEFARSQITSSGEGFSEFDIPGCRNSGEEGNPLLPLYAADLLLPPGQEISEVIISEVQYYEEMNGIKVMPASRQFPISKGMQEGYKPQPNPKIYSSTGPYPANIIGNISTGFLSGHSIGSFSVCPVIYYPAEDKITAIRDITVIVRYAPTDRASLALDFLRNSNTVLKRINHLVENADELKKYSYPPSKSIETDLLLITKNSLLPSFADYIDFKRSTGFFVTVMTTEDIFAQYQGQDNMERIRNCIIEYYTSFNLEYVILGGDADPNNPTDRIVPHRGFASMDDDDIPSDMYYSCLDGNWNEDGDLLWGEQGETDLYAEVAVGRLCVDNATEITNFTNKLKFYQDYPVVADIKKVLMVGEELNNNPPTYGDTYKEEIALGSSNHGFTTTGVPTDFQISRLYDTQGGWDKYDVFQKFNTTGINLLNHLGHSSVTYNMRMETTDLTTSNFTNNGTTRGFVIGYSQGCYNGSFDNRDDWGGYSTTDCFAEKITTIGTAEVAAVANSRYGWYSPGNTNSTSQYVDRQFFDAIFGEDITVIGFVNSDSKEDNASYFTNDAYMKWVVYETNLFGDPSMDIWTDTPTDITVTYPSQISIGAASVNVTTNAPFARIGMVQDGELIGRAIAGSNGNASIQFTSPVIGAEPIEVSVIAHNRNRHQGTITVFTNQACVLFDSYLISDPAGNNNGIAEFGELIDLSLGVKNVGELPANNVSVSLSSPSGYAMITDNSENYGNLEPGQTVFIEDAFGFIVAPDIPDQFEIPFIVTATGGGVWNSTFSLIASAPVLDLGEYTISDPSGNNDGRLDPGENATISFEAMNTGHSNAPETNAELLTSCNYITISNPSFSLGTLETGEEDNAVFNIAVDPSAPIGTMAHFLVRLTSGEYETEREYTAKVGRIVEDWESGNFYQFNWQFSGNADWFITTSNPYEGIRCAQSGDITNNQFSILKLSYTVMQDDSISFFVKVSSEIGGDLLDFYINSEIVGSWSGNVAWQRVSFPLTTGTYNFKWFYHKDGSTSSGSDCAWLDYIELPAPASTSASAGMDDDVCTGSSFDCDGIATNYTAILWSTSGDGFFSNPAIADPTYTPGALDITNGSVILTISVTGPDGTFTDEMTLTIYPVPVVDLGSDTTVYYYETVMLDAGNPGSSYLWSTGATTQTIEAGSGGITGVLTFWVEVTNDGDCVSSDEIIISFEEYTGSEASELSDPVIIYPNPTSGKFTIQVNHPEGDDWMVRIYNSVSGLVFEMKPEYKEAEVKNQIDLNGLPGGVYFIHFTGNGLQEVRKLILR
jgi:hypothetical protein